MYLFANWKMYLNAAESENLARALSVLPIPAGVDLAVFPNALAYRAVSDILASSRVELGAQNVAWTPQGAYTGATSALMFKEAGATYALVGHSERRHIFGENDDVVRKKIEACSRDGITSVLCVGETNEDRQNDKRQYRLKKQLMVALEGLKFTENNLIIAYEPVWAIGTGEPCLPTDVEDVAGWIRLELASYGPSNVSVLYGGSVNSENISSFVSLPSVGGVLVGSAGTGIAGLKSMLDAIR
ncbi:MAG: triose-phosphate isomerase [Patescibacteria group bacterium]